MLLLVLYLTGYLSFFTVGQPIQYKVCDKAPSNIKSVNISPCSDDPCIFHHNTTVKVEVTFTAQMNSSSLKAQIYGIVAGIPVSFPMPNPDGCNKSGIACPISQGSEYTYQSVFNVIPSYPDISLVVQWDLKDRDGKYEFCFLFPMQIKK